MAKGLNRERGIEDTLSHNIADDNAGGVTQAMVSDDPATHDVGDDNGVDNPATHDVGDDNGVDNPATHDVGDDRGVDDPATHDLGDDHGGADTLRLFVNERTGQLVFSADQAECVQWANDGGKQVLDVAVGVPTAGDDSVAVWRFHDPKSDVYFWTANEALKDSIVQNVPAIEFEGEAFRAYSDDASGGHLAIGLVWDRDAGGDFGNFVYAPVDAAIALAGQSQTDGIEYFGVAFWL
jgi:hypothetical protein